jgi:hypothetical protein
VTCLLVAFEEQSFRPKMPAFGRLRQEDPPPPPRWYLLILICFQQESHWESPNPRLVHFSNLPFMETPPCFLAINPHLSLVNSGLSSALSWFLLPLL